MTILISFNDYFDAITARMIPPAPGWPSTPKIGELLIPALRESEWGLLQSALEHLGTFEAFQAAGPDGQDIKLAALEANRPEDFEILLRLVYLGYYAHPDVVLSLQNRGYDIKASPQPEGYSMAPFDPSRVPSKGPGVWIPTEDVRYKRHKGL